MQFYVNVNATADTANNGLVLGVVRPRKGFINDKLLLIVVGDAAIAKTRWDIIETVIGLRGYLSDSNELLEKSGVKFVGSADVSESERDSWNRALFDMEEAIAISNREGSHPRRRV